MIIYNMRHNGPYEYEKFLLNIFQYNNAINHAEDIIEKEEQQQYLPLSKQIADIFTELDQMSARLDIIQEKR